MKSLIQLLKGANALHCEAVIYNYENDSLRGHPSDVMQRNYLKSFLSISLLHPKSQNQGHKLTNHLKHRRYSLSLSFESLHHHHHNHYLRFANPPMELSEMSPYTLASFDDLS